MKVFTITGSGALVEGVETCKPGTMRVAGPNYNMSPMLYIGDMGRGQRPIYLFVGREVSIDDNGWLYRANLIKTKSGFPLLVEEKYPDDRRALLLVGPHHAFVRVRFDRQPCVFRGQRVPAWWVECHSCGERIRYWGDDPTIHPESGDTDWAPLPEGNKYVDNHHRVQVVAWARRGTVSASAPRWQTPAFLLILFPGARLEVCPETYNERPLGAWKAPREITWSGKELRMV